jgi:hypothetical protein
VVVQPGFFYDSSRPGIAVVALLPEPERFASGAAALSVRLRAAAG